MGERWFLNNDERIDGFIRYVRGKASAGEPVTVEFVRPGRNPDQNALLHTILREVSRQKGDETAEELKRYVKLVFGVPELRATDAPFRKMYDESIKPHLTYENKLEAMDILPVTSRMDTEQFSRLIDSVVRHYSSEGYTIDMPQ
jgi:hypothetical protein